MQSAVNIVSCENTAVKRRAFATRGGWKLVISGTRAGVVAIIPALMKQSYGLPYKAHSER